MISTFRTRTPTRRATAAARQAVSALALAGGLAAAGPALAQTTDAAGADALEGQTQGLLDSLFDGAPDADVRFDGSPEARPNGDHYVLAVPPIAVDVEDDFSGRLEAFEALVYPRANGWQDVRWSFVSPFTARNPSGDADLTLTFTGTPSRVVVAPEYQTVMEAEVGIIDLVLSDAASNGSGTASLLSMAVQSEPVAGADHLYAAQSEFELRDLAITNPDGETFNLGSISFGGATERQRLDLFALFAERMRGIDPEDDEAVGQLFAEMLVAHGDEKWLGSASFGFALEAMAFAGEDATFSIGVLDSMVSAADLDQPASDLGIRMSFADIASPDLPPAMAPVIPTVGELDLLAADAPLEAVLGEVRGRLGSGAAEMGPKGRRMGTGVDLAALEALDPMQLLGIVLASDALVTLERLFVEAPIGYVEASGTVDPDPAAALQMTAALDVTIAGLPEMIAFAQQMGGDAAEAAGLASAIAAMGRDATDAGGRATKQFDLEVTAQGQVLLNGNDLSPMLGMFQ